jgi:Tol biopolymer transport system component
VRPLCGPVSVLLGSVRPQSATPGKEQLTKESTRDTLFVVVALVVVVLFIALVVQGHGGTSRTTSASPSARPSVAVSPEDSASPLPTPTVTGTIAFSRVNAAGTGADIYLVHANGTGLTRLARGSGRFSGHPSWSPDGTRVVYHSGSEAISAYTIWVVHADGSRNRPLTGGSVRGLWPSWSPDGKHIAFSRYVQVLGQARVAVMDADGSHVRTLTRGAHLDEFPAWASRGRLLFLRDGDVFAVDLDGSRLVPVRRRGNVGGFALSPDGTSIVIDDDFTQRVLLAPVRGSGTSVILLDLTDPAVGISSAHAGWTQDGKVIALANNDLATSVGSPLYIVNADGSGLSAVPGVETAYDPAWRPQ